MPTDPHERHSGPAPELDHANEALRCTENAETITAASERSGSSAERLAQAAQAQVWATLAVAHRTALADEHSVDALKRIEEEVERFKGALEDRPVT